MRRDPGKRYALFTKRMLRRSENLSVEDACRSVRPTGINIDKMKELVESKPTPCTTRRNADIFQISKLSVKIINLVTSAGLMFESRIE